MVKNKKRCNLCKKLKIITEFYKHKSTKDLHRAICKECSKFLGKEYRKNHLEEWNAKRRKILFKLSKKQLDNLINLPCFYCNSHIGIGVDRKDNDKGYLINNCVPCCPRCNRMKSNLDLADFVEHISKIYKRRKEIKSYEI